MKTALLATVALATIATAHEYDYQKGWPTTPEGLETIGDSHGEIDVDSEGNFYVSVVGGAKSGVQIYDASGKPPFPRSSNFSFSRPCTSNLKANS
jgi:hypothetical protein